MAEERDLGQQAQRRFLEGLNRRFQTILVVAVAPTVPLVYLVQLLLRPCWQFAILLAVACLFSLGIFLAWRLARRGLLERSASLAVTATIVISLCALLLREHSEMVVMLALVAAGVYGVLFWERLLYVTVGVGTALLVGNELLVWLKLSPAGGTSSVGRLLFDGAHAVLLVPVVMYLAGKSSAVTDVAFAYLRRQVEGRRGVLEEIEGVQGRISPLLGTVQELAARLQRQAGEQVTSAERVAQSVASFEQTVREALLAAAEHRARSDASKQAAATSRDQLRSAQSALRQLLGILEAVREDGARLAQSSRRTGEVIVSIHDIDEQINLLAVNAALEASKAGEAGQGFAVIAGELRELIASTSSSARRGGQLLATISREATAATEDTNRSAEALRGHLGQLEEAARLVDQIAEGFLETLQRVDGIASSAERQQTITQAIAQASQDLKQSAQQLLRSAEELARDLVRVADSHAALEGLLRPGGTGASGRDAVGQAHEARARSLQAVGRRAFVTLLWAAAPGVLGLYGWMAWATPGWPTAVLLGGAIALVAVFVASWSLAVKGRATAAVTLAVFGVQAFATLAQLLVQDGMMPAALAQLVAIVCAAVYLPRRVVLGGAFAALSLLAAAIATWAGLPPVKNPPLLALAYSAGHAVMLMPLLIYVTRVLLRLNEVPLRHLREATEAHREALAALERLLPGIEGLSARAEKLAVALAAQAQQQAVTARETERNLDELRRVLEEQLQAAEAAIWLAVRTGEQARQSGEGLDEVVTRLGAFAAALEMVAEGIGQLSADSLDARRLVDAIEDIHRQVNVLAINAAIEGARTAQEGFQAVAKDLREMLGQTSGDVRRGRQLLEQIRQEAVATLAETRRASGELQLQVPMLRGASERVGEVTRDFLETSRHIEAVAAGAERQRAALDSIREAMAQMQGSSTGTTEAAGELAESVRTLSGAGEQLRRVLGGDGGAALRVGAEASLG